MPSTPPAATTAPAEHEASSVVAAAAPDEAAGTSEAEFTALAAYALAVLPRHRLGEAVAASLPWAEALPPAARRMLETDVAEARGHGSAQLTEVLATWQVRAQPFAR